ncbi:DUF2971 domain-containing protein [Aeromonas veronii]|uniref:DUF2971 domain-containing protein n=1 Tax=Aeromonas veronii TaxID=654 RepID=UPI003BA2BCD8
MNKIYKYMKFRPDFFKKPSLRLSQRCALNDPFELSPDQDTLDKILEDAHREDFFQQISEYASDEGFDDTGIISFTESYNNLLMWSHYADEHKGIVIEFDYHALKTHFNKILSVSNSIERVLYNRERHEVLPCTTSPKRNLLTKSDDWIYEKEHRVITKISNADYFVINKEAYEYILDFYDESYLELLNVEKYKGMIKISINHQACHLMDQQEKDGSSTDDMEEMRFSPSNTILNELLSFIAAAPTSIFLFDIPIECITGIFLGCRLTESDKSTLREVACENKLFNRIPCYQASLSKHQFALIFEETYHSCSTT